MIVYHRTTPDVALKILTERQFTSQENGEVCVSNQRHGHASGYGTAVVVLNIPARLLTLDDEFDGGENHYRVHARDIRPSYIRSIDT